MRIRKNAKTSAFLHTTSNNNNNNLHETTLCLLNQSPWDIITFPASTHSSSSTSIHLFDDFVTRYNVNAAANWSSPDSDKPIIQSVASTKNSNECEYDIINENVDKKTRNYESYEKEEDKLGFMKGCVKQEDSFVDIQNDAVCADKKKAQTVPKSCSSKKRAVNTSKQNEFYYYSGFGPSWGKKRGCTTFNACGTHVTTSSNDGDMDMDVDEGKTRVGPDTTTMKTVWSCQVVPGEEDFDYVEQVNDKEKDKEKTVKKRGRKPIKARSLKSLM
ncbi:hypothetical protein HanPI659440_Chr16g0649751 [Helianthus annuus]|nr:hypothetical protein HanPI659440_Chr16g0649751 [Helianthus annuus]